MRDRLGDPSLHPSASARPIAPSQAAIALATRRAAASSNIATAARRFGDRVPPPRREWPIRRITQLRPLTGNDAPLVGIIIPTCGEPVPMVLRTVLSVIKQDYPARARIIIVSDDGHDPELEGALVGLGVHYHTPPDRWAPGRDGAPKSGNLNSALAYLLAHFGDVRYIETRDADDEVGSEKFLRQTVGQLESDPGLAFVQTIKEAQVSAGDPFCNFDAQFYRSQMFTRNAANAVFPCGSGLLWRRQSA